MADLQTTHSSNIAKSKDKQYPTMALSPTFKTELLKDHSGILQRHQEPFCCMQRQDSQVWCISAYGHMPSELQRMFIMLHPSCMMEDPE
jgi:hypothetical protein